MTNPDETQPRGADGPAIQRTQNQPVESASDSDSERWTRRLTQALQILDLRVDRMVIAELAERVASSVGPTSVPLTAFVVGYAAGLTAASGEVGPAEATRRAADVALRLCGQPAPAAPRADGPDGPSSPDGEDPDASGWAATAQ